MKIYECGDFPYRSQCKELVGVSCISSTLGITYPNGFTDKVYKFEDGSEACEFRGAVIYYVGSSRDGICIEVENI